MTVLATRHLTLAIQQKQLCRALTFSIQPGEIWGLLGPNGAGKTTLLHALAGLYPAAKNLIYLQQKPLHQLSAKIIAQHIALLFQDMTFHFPQSVLAYCLASRYPHQSFYKTTNDEDHRIVNEALNTMGLQRLASRCITTLSGGEKRRLAIAAVLAQTPLVYLLDEPANQLDLRYQHIAFQHFRALTKTASAAVIMSLHDINLAAQYCDHVLLLFPDGSTLHGKTTALLTEEHLSRLYQCTVRAVSHEARVFWYAEA